MFIRKSEYEKMKEELRCANRDCKFEKCMREYCESKLEKAESKMLDKDWRINELEIRIQEMEQRELLYKKYYKLDTEPSEDTIVKVRTDLRVHELEMEVMKNEIMKKSKLDYKLRANLRHMMQFC